MDNRDYTDLISEAQRAHFKGWDFSYIKDRWSTEVLPWDYCDRVRKVIKSADSLLDLGTGGGEVLASFMPLPAHTYATEGHNPNVEIARMRLEPLGVQVINTGNDSGHHPLPFPDGEFDLITDRHTGASADELWRCLKESGIYISEQVGDQDAIELINWFTGKDLNNGSDWNLETFVKQLTQNGFRIEDAQEAYPVCTYKDVGAVVYYLKAIPWMVPDFDVIEFGKQLHGMHEHICRHGGFFTRRHRFFVHAVKDSG